MILEAMQPQGERNNTAPTNRKLRDITISRSSPQFAEEESEEKRIKRRSRKITLSLFCLIASISCLSPYISLHLTQRVGLLLFEADILQLRSSIFSLLICLIVLVILHSIIIVIKRRSNRKSLFVQKTFRQLIGLFAFISALSYLSIALIVPHIKQVQRMPIATFDCNANLITIENCYQQFTTQGGEQTVFQAIIQLLTGNLNGNSERLIKRLNCLKYNDKELESLEVPTRFLLHKCGLVCKPQRQQLHQFSDDLNREQVSHWSGQVKPDKQITISTESSLSKPNLRLVPPYNHADSNNKDLEDREHSDQHYVYHNASSKSEQFVKASEEQNSQSQVSLKVCFSGEFSGGSNYKQFCITNLANHHNQDHTLTVGQLNAMLRKIIPNDTIELSNSANQENTKLNEFVERQSEPQEAQSDQTTHYVNPVVQFESHFKNWPHLPIDGPINEDNEENWCKFRPIPPFIVNNKPFSDIQCSLEHEYTMTTGPPLDSILDQTGSRGSEKIYLKKAGGGSESYARERCNIQCKVNILYQVHVKDELREDKKKRKKVDDYSTTSSDLHYYLPLKPCVIVSGEGDKSKTSNYYLILRSIGDSSLVLVFILIDFFLLIESIDTKQFQLEAKKFRFIGLLLIIALVPLIVAFLFELIWLNYPYYTSRGRKEGYLISFLYEQVFPTLTDLFSTSSGLNNKKKISSTYSDGRTSTNSTNNLNNVEFEIRKPTLLIVDNYLLPFFIYSIIMFTLALNSLAIPLVSSTAPLTRVSSTEELGMSPKLNRRLNKTRKHQPSKANDSDAFAKKRSGKLYKKLTIKMISLYLVALFMGTQFNLSQLTQTQILIESFGLNQANRQSYATLWFVIGTHSSAALFALLLALLFIDEITVFFSNFSPFRSTISASSSSNDCHRNRAKFLQYLTPSVIIYSTRYLAISSVDASSRFRWLVVFLFQVAELFNFPLTWFALTTRAHEITIEHRAKSKSIKPVELNQRPASNSRSLDAHILIQSSMAIAYFAISRSIALFVHSIYASLHLHSDNVDWFITSFYKSTNGLNEKQNTTHFSANPTNDQSNARPDSLFSPLPGERQTYLHASRLFLKHNSLLCLLFGLFLLIALLYVKYQIWAEQKRTLEVYQSRSMDENSIDDRLSLDLMRIHNSTRNIYPDANRGTNFDSRSPSPRAKILFHYNLGRRDSSDSSENAPNEAHRKLEPIRKELPIETKFGRRDELRIPIEMEEQDGGPETNKATSSNDDEMHFSGQVVERVVKRRNKKVRIYEDNEIWPEEVDKQLSKQEPNTAIYSQSTKKSHASSESIYPEHNGKERSRKGRSITFAPITTLIGDDGSSEQHPHQMMRDVPIKRASPEPSIDFESSNDEDSIDNNNDDNS